MPSFNLREPRKALAAILFALLLCTSVFAQDTDERSRAFQLYKDAKYTEALPVFEKLAAANPKDPELFETYGLLVLAQNAYLKDPAARKQARQRGRDLLVQAQKMGADSQLLKAMIERVPADGGEDDSFSTKKEVEEAMREGEGAFASGNMPKALELYQRALLLDPKLYEAALFTGDVYYKTGEQIKASEWFGRAAAINPDRETAYRYWGDSLMRQGRLTEAGEKFVEAYIAEPYNRLARGGFISWAEKAHIGLAHPRVDRPANVTKTDEKNTTITLDAGMFNKDKGGSAGAWMMYGIIRASWQTKFAEAYPNEKTYRHSLKEEVAALRGAIESTNTKKPDPKNLDASLQNLIKLNQDGLLEPYVLLALPDEGIAQDFAAYRRDNIDKLRRYVKEYVMSGGGKQQ